jgi:hypothetical protein
MSESTNEIYLGHDGECDVYLLPSSLDGKVIGTQNAQLVKRWEEYDENRPLWWITECMTDPRGYRLALNWLAALELYLKWADRQTR